MVDWLVKGGDGSGDKPGHEFHGNQYTDTSSEAQPAPAPRTVSSDVVPVKSSPRSLVSAVKAVAKASGVPLFMTSPEVKVDDSVYEARIGSKSASEVIENWTYRGVKKGDKAAFEDWVAKNSVDVPVAYRGLLFKGKIPSFGEKITIDKPVSISRSAASASVFAGGPDGTLKDFSKTMKKGVMLVIRGARGIPIEHISKFSHYGGEKEIVAAPGTFSISGRYRDGDGRLWLILDRDK